MGSTFQSMLRSGIEQSDSKIGVYAGDAYCYETFAEFFDPILAELNNLSEAPVHNFESISKPIVECNLSYSEILSARIRVARNIAGYPFTGQISREERIKLEADVVRVLDTLPQPWRGKYYSYASMTSVQLDELKQRNQVFGSCDRFQISAGMAEDWPTGRGVFISSDNRFSVWINEEDHLRIITTQPGGNLGEVFNHGNAALKYISRNLNFSYSDRLGFLTSCPSNVGTGMRASYHIQLPNLGQTVQQLKKIANEQNLDLRGTDGEHTRAIENIFDVSFGRRLGVNEHECLTRLLEGTATIINMERSLRH